MLVPLVAGAHETLDRGPLRRRERARVQWLGGVDGVSAVDAVDEKDLPRSRGASAAFYVTLAVAAVWLAIDGAHAARAVRNWRAGQPLAEELAPEWGDPELQPLFAKINQYADEKINTQAGAPESDQWASNDAQGAGRVPVVVATNPWLIHWRTGLPAAMLPLDLSGEEWLNYINNQGSSVVVVDPHTWPPEQEQNKRELTLKLASAGWELLYSSERIQAWQRNK